MLPAPPEPHEQGDRPLRGRRHQVKKWRTSKEKGVETEKWCETGIYPTTFESAILRVREWLLMDEEDVCDIDAALEAVAKANKKLVSALRKVKA